MKYAKLALNEAGGNRKRALKLVTKYAEQATEKSGEKQKVAYHKIRKGILKIPESAPSDEEFGEVGSMVGDFQEEEMHREASDARSTTCRHLVLNDAVVCELIRICNAHIKKLCAEFELTQAAFNTDMNSM
jgi:hypothetical protein